MAFIVTEFQKVIYQTEIDGIHLLFQAINKIQWCQTVGTKWAVKVQRWVAIRFLDTDPSGKAWMRQPDPKWQ